MTNKNYNQDEERERISHPENFEENPTCRHCEVELIDNGNCYHLSN